MRAVPRQACRTLFGLSAALLAAGGEEMGRPEIRMDSRPVGFSVAKDRQAVLDLKKERAGIFDGGGEQPIALFEPPSAKRRMPIEAAFRPEVGGTVMRGGLFDASTLENAFPAGLQRGASISIYSFAQEKQRLCAPTRDAAAPVAGSRAKRESLCRRLFTHGVFARI